MGRSFQIVEQKVRETEFFLDKLEKSSLDIIAAQYYLSAFLSASRSITFTIQSSLNDLEGFREWYKKEQEKLKENQLAKYFVFARNHSQKVGFYPIGSGRTYKDEEGKLRMKIYFTYWYTDKNQYVPEMDVIESCKLYFKELLKIVRECYQKFGARIDPNFRYTEEGMKALNMTIEDVEEENGFPRGWTSMVPDEERIKIFWKNNYNLGVDDIFFKYLGTNRKGEKNTVANNV